MEKGDTTAQHAAKFKKDKDPEGDRRRANDRLTMLSISAREKKSLKKKSIE